MTHTELVSAVRALGMTVRWTGDDYRVNHRNGREATAYYTDSRDDALGTAKAMSERAPT